MRILSLSILTVNINISHTAFRKCGNISKYYGSVENEASYRMTGIFMSDEYIPRRLSPNPPHSLVEGNETLFLEE